MDKELEVLLDPPAAAMRKRFKASARALMTNRPLSEVASPASQTAAALSDPELAALQRVGLSTRPFAGGAAGDPLSNTIIDYMALVETSYTAAQAATMLGVDVSRIRQRLRPPRSLFGMEHEGVWRLPRFQFERKKVLPGLAEVLAVLPSEINPLDVAAWFVEPNADLESEGEPTPPSPRQWLLRGNAPSAVVRAARHL